MTLLSIVIPCFNERESILPFLSGVANSFKEADGASLSVELLFIDDGSSDDTFEVIRQEKKPAPFVSIRCISFSRNFGKEAALCAGLQNSNGDYVATMDVDLQDPPSLLPEMLELLEQGEYDCIATKRVTRDGEPIIRSFLQSNSTDSLISYLILR